MHFLGNGFPVWPGKGETIFALEGLELEFGLALAFPKGVGTGPAEREQDIELTFPNGGTLIEAVAL